MIKRDSYLDHQTKWLISDQQGPAEKEGANTQSETAYYNLYIKTHLKHKITNLIIYISRYQSAADKQYITTGTVLKMVGLNLTCTIY